MQSSRDIASITVSSIKPKTPTAEIKANQILTSTLPVTETSKGGSRATTIKQLREEAKEKKMGFMITFTPGPFAEEKDIPKTWMETPPAKGCTKQLEMTEKSYDHLNAMIFAANRHGSEYQAKLLPKKNLDKVHLLSDEKEGLEFKKEFGFEMLEIDGKKYIPRFTIAVNPAGDTAKLFELPSPVTPDIMDAHIKALSEFVGVRPEKRTEFGTSCTA